MEKNRVFSRITKEMPDIGGFATFSSFSSSPPFSDFDIQALIDTAKSQSFVEGFMKGQEEAIGTVDEFVTAQIEKFILLNTKITDFVKKVVERHKTDKIKLVEARVNFNHLTSGIVSILFIIESDIEQELWFAQLLSRLGKIVLEQDKHIAELRFINQKGKKINKGLINSEFPRKRLFSS